MGTAWEELEKLLLSLVCSAHLTKGNFGQTNIRCGELLVNEI
jgi:hypothetical protein